MSYEDLTSEQGEKLAERQTPEETLALVQEEDFDLTDDELEGISGGRLGYVRVVI